MHIFKDMTKSKERGKGYPPGFIKLKILLFIMYYQNKAKGPDIKEFLKIFGVTSKNTLNVHLKGLEKEGSIIRKEGIDLCNLWGIPYKLESVSRIIEKFLESHSYNDKFYFVYSPIFPNFINYLIKKVEQMANGKFSANNEFLLNIILRHSPSALEHFLDTFKPPSETRLFRLYPTEKASEFFRLGKNVELTLLFEDFLKDFYTHKLIGSYNFDEMVQDLNDENSLNLESVMKRAKELPKINLDIWKIKSGRRVLQPKINENK
jgi:hypothetical protein